MELQQFGTIEIGGKAVEAMLCMDFDRHDEATVHWWGKDIQASAVMCKLLPNGDGTTKLEPKILYRTNEVGSLFIPRLSTEEIQVVNGYRAQFSPNGHGFDGEWSNVSGMTGKMSFSYRISKSDITPEICSNWNDFKIWASRSRQNYDAVQFRGHGSNLFDLKTTLHRANIHRLERYCSETLQRFREHAESILDMHIDLENGDDYSLLLGLAQHHGLPTPLLDWTRSPYIAAFFAFTDALESTEIRPNVTHVRIYGLTREFATRFFAPKVSIPYYAPYICPLTISGRKNPRLYAQQGQFLVTNISNLECHIRHLETQLNTTLLIAADIPIKFAAEALDDLSFMGLSAATLFPGLDGVCRMMKHSMLFKRQPINTGGGLSSRQESVGRMSGSATI